jgi:hypothetical protein
MTPDTQIAARETNRLHIKKSRLGMSSEKNTNVMVQLSHGMKKLRLNMSPDKKTNMGRKQLMG